MSLWVEMGAEECYGRAPYGSACAVVRSMSASIVWQVEFFSRVCSLPLRALPFDVAERRIARWTWAARLEAGSLRISAKVEFEIACVGLQGAPRGVVRRGSATRAGGHHHP